MTGEYSGQWVGRLNCKGWSGVGYGVEGRVGGGVGVE